MDTAILDLFWTEDISAEKSILYGTEWLQLSDHGQRDEGIHQ